MESLACTSMRGPINPKRPVANAESVFKPGAVIAGSIQGLVRIHGAADGFGK